VLGAAEPAQETTATTAPPAAEDELVLADEDGARLRLGAAALTGEAVGDARAVLDAQTGTRWGGPDRVPGCWRPERWAELTGNAACQAPGDPRRRVAIVLDRQVISSPQVDPSVQCEQGITGGQTVISGAFTDREASDLALLIRAGALPVPVEVVEQRTVGPTLGEAAIRASTQAAVLGAALTMLYMIAYYRLLGGLAAVALVCYGLLSFAVLLALRATLTLPGVAGFVLAIGMAVDANVLVFERMREEHRAGAGLVARGPNFGVEFTGGRLLEYRTARPVDLDAARRALADAGVARAVVQASGDGNLTVRTGQLDQAGEERVQRAVAAVGGRAEELRDEFIGPTIGAELRRKALLALGIALLVQLGYLAVRFRWSFGTAAVIAMFHDVAILLGLFAWLGKPLDGVFLAALLTVVG